MSITYPSSRTTLCADSTLGVWIASASNFLPRVEREGKGYLFPFTLTPSLTSLSMTMTTSLRCSSGLGVDTLAGRSSFESSSTRPNP